ncbi:photosynthetic reaction center cytochrome c subunit [Rhodoferax sp. U2-2l]|uniref:photosynthetic reaction center cytochrome PufC n=1 Tax=Rhodoferax sp. U2-2l TaxID=2884000 RepID=UPI001D0B3FCE|nr:photosynthetic reaction center cytochrome PufC [Rhodoferax sp. U2-2l]MCB8746600.1 photosynthetic reaction center cytochrome c subunit [Rhodoferax sp. U2-2l]
MTMTSNFLRFLALGCLVLLAGCERPVPDSVQRGYRGTGMLQVYNPRILDAITQANVPPVALAPASPEGPRASQVFQNVKVLGDTSAAEFTRIMTAITEWVSPVQGCAYCHDVNNYADDAMYTKVVSRRMLEMTRHINTEWTSHVVATGVTCYTCHRGQPIPSEIWFKQAPQANGSNFIGDAAGQNLAAISVKYASLPSDPFTPFLLEAKPVRVYSTTALPSGNNASIKQAEWTYSLMTHMSSSLNVNCTYCHNSRSFAEWDGAPPQRVTAWHGIQMSRSLNVNYLEPLRSAFPANRLGPTGDAPKVNCATCHQSAYKPMNGAPMLKDYPELGAPRPSPTATVAAN